MICEPSPLKIWTMWRSDGESSRTNVYVPAGRICPGISIGWLKVITVFLFHSSARAPGANVAPSSVSANTAKIVFTNFMCISSQDFANPFVSGALIVVQCADRNCALGDSFAVYFVDSKKRAARCSKPCVCGHSTAGSRDHPSRGRPGPACQLFARPPEQHRCQRGQSQNEESDAEEGERNQKFMYEVKIKIKSCDRGDRYTGAFDNVRSTQQAPLG